MCLSTRKQFRSCGVNASRVRQQGSSLRVEVSMHHAFVDKEAVWELWCQCIMCSLTRKQLKSFDAIASCVRRQGSSLRVVVSMHHVFFDRGAV